MFGVFFSLSFTKNLLLLEKKPAINESGNSLGMPSITGYHLPQSQVKMPSKTSAPVFKNDVHASCPWQ